MVGEVADPELDRIDAERRGGFVQRGLQGDLRIGTKTLGLVLDIGGYYKNVITLAPSLEITAAEMDLAASALEHVLVRAKESLAV